MAKLWANEMSQESHKPQGRLKNVPLFRICLFCLVSWICFRHYIAALLSPQDYPRISKPDAPQCPQVDPLYPAWSTTDLDDLESWLVSQAFQDVAVERLSGAVQIRTESFDDMGQVGADPRWDIFYSFADYLGKTFPLTHTVLQLEKINTHALLYTWPGTDPTLKPNLLMAHQDVVPVPDSTVKQWTYPPFSGHFDGKYLWGRGSNDCKNQLIAILSAVEALLSAGFIPQRTLILSFGFDEEISGHHGANYLSNHLLSKLGHHSVASIVDEGAPNLESWGAGFAIPGVAEKGHIDVNIVVRLNGGHSSIPPKHTSIGIAAELISLIEGNPYEPHLADDNPYLQLLYCGAEHAPEFPHKLQKLLGQRSSEHRICSKKPKKDKLAIEAAKAGLEIKYLFTTSLAVDLIQGGVKVNALPERTEFTINHRINVGSESSVVKLHIASLAAQVSHKHNLTLHAFSGKEEPNSIFLDTQDSVLEPAPITPTVLKSSSNDSNTTPFAVLAGTARALYEGIFVSPGIMTGNTDTRWYWDLSEHIFRYAPGWDKNQVGLGNIHTVDEKVSMEAHVDTVRWMWSWIRNMDEANL